MLDFRVGNSYKISFVINPMSLLKIGDIKPQTTLMFCSASTPYNIQFKVFGYVVYDEKLYVAILPKALQNFIIDECNEFSLDDIEVSFDVIGIKVPNHLHILRKYVNFNVKQKSVNSSISSQKLFEDFADIKSIEDEIEDYKQGLSTNRGDIFYFDEDAINARDSYQKKQSPYTPKVR